MATTLRMGQGAGGWRRKLRPAAGWGVDYSQTNGAAEVEGLSKLVAPDPPLVVTFMTELGQEHVSGGCVGLPGLYLECLVLQLIKQ